MKSYLPSKIRFLHIPKTAGLSFSSLLLNLYNEEEPFVFKGNLKVDSISFKNCESSYKKKLKVILGHAPIQTGIGEVDQYPLITMLRNPLKRVMSFCQHVWEGKSKEFYPIPYDNNFDLDIFLNSGLKQLNNLQTKSLINSCCNLEDDKLLNEISNIEAIDLAIKNLESKFLFWGIQDNFKGTINSFKEKFNLSSASIVYEELNISSKVQRLTFKKRHIEKIKSLNLVDLMLFKSLTNK